MAENETTTHPFPAQLRHTQKSDLLNKFLAYDRTEIGLSETTVSAYQKRLTRFLKGLGRGKSLLKVQRKDIHRFLSTLPPRDIAAHLTALRMLFRFLQIDGYLHKDPTLGIRMPQAWRRLPRVLSREEVLSFLEVQPSHPKESLNLRDRAMVELLYASGIRNTELRTVRLDDLRLKDRQLMVNGKGSKQRLVPFGIPAATALENYVRHGRPHLKGNKSGFLFLNYAGRNLTRSGLAQIICRQARAAGLSVYPHLLRHSCATHMLENGANLRVIQEILGHAFVETSAIYTHVSQPHLIRQLRLHPRAKPEAERTHAILKPGSIMCNECRNPVCDKSKTLCAHHLQLNLEACKRSWARKRDRKRLNHRAAA